MTSFVRSRIVTAGFVCLAAALVFPLSALAAEEEGGWGILELVGRFFNLAVVVGVLVFVLRKPLGQMFQEGRENIRQSLAEAQRAHQEAQAKLAEVEKRLSELDRETAEIKKSAQAAAEEESRRTQEQAEKEAERIVAVARREAESLVRAARIELREHAAGLAVELAEGKIRQQLGPEEDRRLAERFADRLGRQK